MPSDAVNSSDVSYFLGFIPTLPTNDMTVSTSMVLQDDEDDGENDDEEEEEEALSIIDNALKSVYENKVPSVEWRRAMPDDGALTDTSSPLSDIKAATHSRGQSVDPPRPARDEFE